jgi:hypothetical protein
MTCDINTWIDGTWHRCIFDPMTALVGEGLFGLLIGAGLWAGLYFGGGGSPTTPTVVVIIVSTLLFPILPEAYVGIAWSMLVVGAAAVALQTLQKYVFDPTTM